MFREFSQDSDAPVTRFEQMLKTNQVYFFDAAEFECIIQFYIDTGEINLAKKALHLGINQHPFHTDLLLLKSEILIFDGDHDDAAHLLNIVEEMDPNNQEVYIQKATIFSKKKLHNEAIELLFKALEFSDDPQEIWCLLAMEYMVLENYMDAKKYFKLSIDEDPDDFQVLYNLLFCLEFLNLNEEAIEILNNILENNPYNEIAWLESGKQYVQMDKNEEALNAFDFAIISEDRFSGAYVEKAKLLEKIGRINEAIEHYQIALQLDDPTAYLLIRIAKCHQVLGNDQLAVQFYHKAIKEDPSSEKGWVAIIDFYTRNKNFKKALYYSEKSLDINEHSVSFWKHNAILNTKLQQFSEAEIAYQNTIELGNYELEIWLGWMDTLVFLNEWEKGYQIGQQAKEFYPNNANIDFRIAGFSMKLSKSIEMEYFLQNVRLENKDIDPKLAELFPSLTQLL